MMITSVNRPRHRLAILPILLLSTTLYGCASTPEPVTEAQVDSIVVAADFDEVWQSTKDVLLEQNFDIYTRDKRGMFVAFYQRPTRFTSLNRSRVTIIIERESSSTTRVSVEAVPERYRMPLLRHPGWKEQQNKDLPKMRELLLAEIEAASQS